MGRIYGILYEGGTASREIEVDEVDAFGGIWKIKEMAFNPSNVESTNTFMNTIRNVPLCKKTKTHK